MNPRNIVVLMCSALLLAAAQAPESPALRQEAAQVVDLLLGADYSALVESSSSRMKQALPEKMLRGPLNKQIRALGAVQAIGEAEFTSTQDIVTVFVPVQFANAAVRFQITFNKAGEVAGLFIRPGKAPATAWKPPPYSKPDSFHSYPVLNHLFQSGKGTSTPAEYNKSGHVSAPGLAANPTGALANPG